MKSPLKSEPVLLYKVKASRQVVYLESLFFLLINISVVQIISGPWLGVMLFFSLLLTIQYFRTDSIVKQFSTHNRIKFAHRETALIWYDQKLERRFDFSAVKIFMSRWFVLLQMGQGRNRIHKLLLADSFDDKSHYTSFRRELIEITDVS